MSDYAHTVRRSRNPAESRTLESRLMFAACFVLFLVRAVLARLMPWRKRPVNGSAGRRESIFSEAHLAASVCVASSFMGF